MAGRLVRIAGLAALLVATAASADPLVVTLITDRAGAGSSARAANGMADYLEMLNQRDGGVAGHRIGLVECEIGSDPARALACLDEAAAAGAVVVGAPDRAVTQALAEPAARRRIPLLSFADGFPVSTRGDLMPWVFNPSASVLGGFTVALRALSDETGRPDGLAGLSIGLAYSAAGADPAALDMLRDLAERYRFSPRFLAMLGEAQGLDGLAEGRPDYFILLGQGVQAGSVLREALRAGVPPGRLVALRWPDDAILRLSGTRARGVREISRHAFGDNFPAFDEIDAYVIDRGLSRTPKGGSGEPHYNRGVYGAVLLAEAIREHRKRRPEGRLTGADLRRGLEMLSVDDSRWKELGLAGFARAVTFDCLDHGGHPALYVQEWDGARWNAAGPSIPQDRAMVDARLAALAAEFRAAHPDWPARTEPCDRPT